MKKNIEQQVVWITGASSGIGKELALQYAARGRAVAISARRMELLENLALEINNSGGDALAVSCDVTDVQSIKNAVEQIVKLYGRIDIAIANAGCGDRKSVV